MDALRALSRELNRYDVLCLGTFLALGQSEFDLLTLSQRLVAGATDSAEVGKYVGA